MNASYSPENIIRGKVAWHSNFQLQCDINKKFYKSIELSKLLHEMKSMTWSVQATRRDALIELKSLGKTFCMIGVNNNSRFPGGPLDLYVEENILQPLFTNLEYGNMDNQIAIAGLYRAINNTLITVQYGTLTRERFETQYKLQWGH